MFRAEAALQMEDVLATVAAGPLAAHAALSRADMANVWGVLKLFLEWALAGGKARRGGGPHFKWA